jgi:hypothetical protein
MIRMVPPSAVIVRRELVRHLRRHRSFVCLLLLASAACVGVASQWPPEHMLQNECGPVAQGILQMMSYLLLGGCAVFVPPLGAATIVSEREQNTLDMLRVTLVRPAGIVAAKFLNTVGFFLLLMTGLVPVLATVFFLLGLDRSQVARAFAVVSSTACACAAIGLVSSSVFRKSFLAIIGSYLGVLAAIGGLPLLTSLAGLIFGIRGYRVFVGTFTQVTAPQRTLAGIFDGSLGTGPFVRFLGYQGLITAAALAVTVYMIRRTPKARKVSSEKPIDDAAVLEARHKRFPYYLIDPRRRKKPIEDHRNPMMVRELRWGMLGRTTTLVRVFYATFILLGASGLVMYRSADDWMLIQFVMVAVIAPAFLATSLAKEYELGNMDMLRMTLLKPYQIVVGKLAAGAISVSPLLLGALAAGIPVSMMTVAYNKGIGLIVAGYMTLLVIALISLSVSLFASLLSRRTSVALILTYLITLLFFGGGWVLLEWAVPLGAQFGIPRNAWGGNTPGGSDFPLTFLSPLSAFRALSYSGRYGMQAKALLYWLVSLCLSVFLCQALIAASIAGFSRFRMKDT